MVVCGGNTGNEIFSEFKELFGYSVGRNAARFETISSISLRMAPSAATSCADLSSSKRWEIVSDFLGWISNLFSTLGYFRTFQT